MGRGYRHVLCSVYVTVLFLSSSSSDKLIQLVEILGSHSVVAAELKQIIGSLRTTEDGKLPSYYYRMQQALCSMASNKEGVTPLYYFDLRQPGSYISISDLKTWPNSAGFTFYAWVCLNVPLSIGQPIESGEQVTEDRRPCRRMLYRCDMSGKHTPCLLFTSFCVLIYFQLSQS